MPNDRYDVEFDDNATTYRMVIIRLKKGHRCGYVSVPESHPFYGKDYRHEIDFDCHSVMVNPTDPIGTLLAAYKAVKDATKMEISYAANIHGGITYANGSDNYPVDGKHWWFGFDAGHAGDDFDGGRPLEFMKQQCKKLKRFLRRYESIEKAA